ncbi:MAG: extracellular solute-binding protein [Ruminococcaceae bacterium]|nr:extracellular solute-binding protein [Oscillospiraceae bacterium]
MKKSLFQKVMCFILSVATLLSVAVMTVSAATLRAEDELADRLKGPNSAAATLEEMQAVVGTTSYEDYASSHSDKSKGGDVITLDNTTAKDEKAENTNGIFIKDLTGDNQPCKDVDSWGGFVDAEHPDPKNTALYLSSKSKVSWTASVNTSGLYWIAIDYYTCKTPESSISSIERKLYINGSIPFAEAGHLNLSKYWGLETLVSVSEPVKTSDADGYFVDYKVINSDDINESGYFKYVTEIKGGMKTVTTYRIKQDINGNSMAPDIIQSPRWSTYYCQDSTGYTDGYFAFYFEAGISYTITLEAEREPVVVDTVKLIPAEKTTDATPSYESVKSWYASQGYTAANGGHILTLEAEFPDFVSDSSVYATNDNTSAGNSPVSSNSQLYNVIGENSYRTVGQWAAYKFKVSKSGLYKISMRYMQNALEGMFICRSVKLTGGHYGEIPEIPFKEAAAVQFNYDKKWQSNYIKDGNGTEFEFYFEEGTEYTVYLECSLGSLRDLIKRVEESLEIINECYLKILQLTGTEPDKYRTYNFHEVMPEVLWALRHEARNLDSIKAEFENLCGTGSHTTTLETIALLLSRMSEDDGEYIAANMSTLKSYLGTLGTWINNSKSSAMVVDSLTISPSDASAKEAVKRAKPNFFKSIWFEIKSFFASFFVDYDQMGLTVKPTKDTQTIDVWLASGRDQSQIWRTMIDAEGSFTDKTGVAVTLKLVTGGTLLPSILSGKGPDVYMGLGASEVINYAIRNAVYGVSGNDKNLTKLEEKYPTEKFNEIFLNTYYTYYDSSTQKYTTLTSPDPSLGEAYITRPFNGVDGVIGYDINVGITEEDRINKNYKFVEAAMDTVTLLGTTYGIPQTMAFAMMFYRMDVLAELGETVPETWDQLLALLPVLQSNNMSIGVNYISALDFMIYQKGGNMWKYPNDPDYQGAQIDLDSPEALEAFDYVCRLYSDYSFPVSYDAANRFRTGEMPIIIGDYAGIYNQLVVYATEIQGLWEFTSLPGWESEKNGVYNYNFNSLAGIGATVILNGIKSADTMRAAWQFVQWETSEDIQGNYGNKMVALIGPSAKYESANVKALDKLSWTASEKEAIEEQIHNLSSIVNYPGSYYINRYTKFAFLAAVNKGADAKEAMLSYIPIINKEIERKRIEFDLPILSPGQTPEDARRENAS